MYAEKIMIVRVDQETPMHFHRLKMEDIIQSGRWGSVYPTLCINKG